VSATLSPPIRIFAFTGVLAAIGLAAFFFLVGRTGGEAATSASEPVVTRTQTATPKPATKAPVARPGRRAAPRASALPAAGYPLPVRRALRGNRVAVVVVYMPGGSVDAVVRAEARAGAQASRAGLVQLSALSERLVQPLVAKTGVLPSPAVLVVKRSGAVAATMSVTDRQTIAQAVAQAR